MKDLSFAGIINRTLIFFAMVLMFINNSLYAQDKMHHDKAHTMDSSLVHRQEMIHSKSPMVMPFEMNKVTHYFINKDDGGELLIKVKNKKDTAQVALIRDHLLKEQKLFSKKDFRDPKTLHGADMPGLKVLSDSTKKFDVYYSEIPRGAKLIFKSEDSTVIKAIHNWFSAQLKDHGSDAKSSLN